MKWVEAVPNLSLAKDPLQIKEIQTSLEQVPELWVLGLEENADAHRTVFTLVGSLAGMEQGLLALFDYAVKFIDMSQHIGEHLRVGAVDVCPLVPLGTTAVKEVQDLVFRLAKYLWQRHHIPVSFYQQSAKNEMRQALKYHRIGQYEGLMERFIEGYLPDVGEATLNQNAGLTIMGARDFLIAYNINLKDSTLAEAKKIARKLRQNRDIPHDSDALLHPEMQEKGSVAKLPHVHIMGWYLPSQGLAQISCNLPNYHQCAMEEVYMEVKKVAQEFGVEVSGSELIGLAPLAALLTNASPTSTDQNKLEQQLQEKVKLLGLDELGPFSLKEKILEYKIKEVTGYDL